MNSYATPAAGTVKLVSFTGTVKIADGHTNISLEGSTKTLSFYSENHTVVNGLKYNFEAYLAELQAGKYLVAYITKVEAAEMDPVESVSITNGATASVEVGKQLTLTASVLPATANPNVTWTTSDATKATVSEDGKVTGVAEGKAVITATTVGKDSTGAAKTATIEITVTKSAAPENLQTVTLSWKNETFKPTIDGEKYIFAEGVGTVTYEKGSTTSGGNFKDGSAWANGNALRIYAKSIATFAVTTGTLYSVTLTMDCFKDNNYCANLEAGTLEGGSITTAGDHASKNHTYVLSPDSGSNSIKLSGLAGQVRVNTVTFSYIPA